MLAAVIVLALAGAWLAPTARADGDPASDVLASQALFVPQDAGVAEPQRAQLDSMLRALARGGQPMRVAIVASPTDLGSVGALWNHPETYAKFLAGELRLVYRGPVMIVMPDRFATFDERTFMSGPSSAALGATAIAAVRQFAGRAHVTLPPSTATATTATSGSSNLLPWLVFALGAIAIAAAWAASLRARPLRSPQ